MTEFLSWSETPASPIGIGAGSPEDRQVELLQRDAERTRNRAALEARLASDRNGQRLAGCKRRRAIEGGRAR